MPIEIKFADINMSYKVETERKEHEELLGRVMAEWSRQDYDVHLVSSEGHKIFSHKVILSFYSSFLNEILNDPVTMFTPGPVTISIPAPISTIAALLKVLVNGRVGTNDREVSDEVKEAAKSLGIQMRNCFVDAKRLSTSAGLTVIKLPLKKPGGEKHSLNSSVNSGIPRPLKIVPKSLVSSGTKPTLIAPKSSKKPTLSNSLNTSVVKKSSGLRVELKEFINEETTKPEQKPSLAQLKKKKTFVGKHICDVCQKGFDEERFLLRHRYRAHGIRRGKKSYGSVNVSSMGTVKQEKEDHPPGPPRCRVCSKRFQSQDIVDKHMRKKHGERNLKCDQCEKGFQGTTELKVHKLTHLPDEEKPHQCDICGKRFCQAGQKRVHLKKHHGVIDKPGTKVEKTNGAINADPIGIVNEAEDNVVDETSNHEQEGTENQENTEDSLDTSEMPTDYEIGLEQTEDDPEVESSNIVLETEDNNQILLDAA